MNSEDDLKREAERRIEELIMQVKIARLAQPYSLLAPKPIHFPQFSKCKGIAFSEGTNANDPQLELLYSWGMPRGLRQSLITYPGSMCGDEFADFSIELFGLKGGDESSDEIERLRRRQVGQVQYANAVLETLPMRTGLVFTAKSEELNHQATVLAWRWRVFMDNSSLCLENLWHDLAGWIPYLLGIKYDNPEKMVADANRFAPAFRLCNLIEANLSNIRGGYRLSDIEKWTSNAIESMAQESQRRGKIIPYSFTKFSKAFPLSTSRSNVYNLLTEQDRENLKSRYLKQCNELMAKRKD